MTYVIVEVLCNSHGLERFRIKVLRRFNMPRTEIKPKINIKTKTGELTCLYIGRSIDERQVKNYLLKYLREKGMLEKVVRIEFQQ